MDWEKHTKTPKQKQNNMLGRKETDFSAFRGH